MLSNGDVSASVVPDLAPRVGALAGTVYSSLVGRFSQFDGERYPLHVGDTWLRPPAGCSTHDIDPDEHVGLNTYTPVPGLPGFREAIAQRVAHRTGVPVSDDEVVVTAGATGGLATVLGALVSPGAEVLILAPAWPLIAGMTTAFGGHPVHVPFIGAVEDADGVFDALEAHRSPRTVAVYVNTPNNPTGRVIPAAWLRALVAWARQHGLWIISDEVYEDLSFDEPHTYVRSLAPERAISAWSMSKGFGMSGNRVGYVVGPSAVVAACRKVGTYTYYCAPRVGQIAAERAFGASGQAWVDDARRQYRALGHAAAARLGVAPPEGSTFLFVDLHRFGKELGTESVLRACVDRGLLVAPGSVFGPYPHHVRVCFTAVEPERTMRGIDILAGVLGR